MPTTQTITTVAIGTKEAWGTPLVFNKEAFSGPCSCCPGIPIACCPGNPVPVVLHASFSAKSGTCTCISDNVTLTFDSARAAWEGSAPNDSTCPGIPGGNTLYVAFGCVGGVWFIRAQCTTNPPLSFSGTTISCNPIHVHFDVSLGNPSNCCAGEAHCDVTA